MSDSSTILGRMLEPVSEALSVDVAKRLLQAKADPIAEARLAELRSKSNEGELSDESAPNISLTVRRSIWLEFSKPGRDI